MSDTNASLPEMMTPETELELYKTAHRLLTDKLRDALRRLAEVEDENEALRLCDKPGRGEVEAYYTLAADYGQPVVQAVDALRQRAELAESKLAEVEAANRWIPITEGYPNDNSADYLVRGFEGSPNIKILDYAQLIDGRLVTNDPHITITSYFKIPSAPTTDSTPAGSEEKA